MATRYTYAQLQDLWVQAGGSRTYAPIAAAIALAESGGRSDAINTSNRNGTVDRGLWQINSIHGSQSTFDPLSNARAAVAISKGGTDWRPWCVAWSDGHCGGTFLGAGAPVLRYLPGGATNTGSVPTAGTSNTLVSNPIPGPVGGIIAKILDALGVPTPESVSSAFFQSVRSTVYYVGLVFLGVVMMAWGIILIILSTRTVRAAGRYGAELGGQVAVNRAVFGRPQETVIVEPPPAPVSTVPTTAPAPVVRRPRPPRVIGRAPAPAPPEPVTMVAPRSPGGTFTVTTSKREKKVAKDRERIRERLARTAPPEGVGATFLGGTKGPKPPYKPRHKSRTRIGETWKGSPFDVTDVSMNLSQPPGRHRGD